MQMREVASSYYLMNIRHKCKRSFVTAVHKRIEQDVITNSSGGYRQYIPNLNINGMAALYDLFRTPQPKGETKVRCHVRSVVRDKKSTRGPIQDITRRSAFKKGVVTGMLIALREALCAPFTSPCRAIVRWAVNVRWDEELQWGNGSVSDSSSGTLNFLAV